MSNMAGVVQQLKKEHERLTREIRGIAAALAAFGATYGNSSGRRKLSPAARERIAAAQRARWAKVRSNGGPAKTVVSIPKKRTMSAAARKRIVAAQKARWAAWKAKQKKIA
jgi:hypothetical protein